MDRQTDRILIARPRLHSMQRGKNSIGIEVTLFVSHHVCIAWFLSYSELNLKKKQELT